MSVIKFEHRSEITSGESGDSDSRVFRFIAEVSGTSQWDNDYINGEGTSCIEHAETYCPETFDGMTRGPIRIKQILPKTYEVEVPYSRRDYNRSQREVAADGGVIATISFDIGTENLKVTHGYTEIRIDPTTGLENDDIARPNYKMQNAISVSYDDGKVEVEGANDLITTQDFEIRLQSNQTFFTSGYLASVASLANRMNLAPFLGHESGEVLFRGSRGSIATSGASELALAFSVMQNPLKSVADGETVEMFGVAVERISRTVDGVTGRIKYKPDFYGWDYYWPLVEPDDSGTRLKPVVKMVYRTSRKLFGDFSLFNIPAL